MFNSFELDIDNGFSKPTTDFIVYQFTIWQIIIIFIILAERRLVETSKGTATSSLELGTVWLGHVRVHNTATGTPN